MGKNKRQVLIPEKFKLKPFSDNTIDYVAKNKKYLKQYLKHLHQTYNTMVDFVNNEYAKRDELKELLDEMWEQYGVNDWEVQDIVMQAKLEGKKEILESIREKSGLYDEDDKYKKQELIGKE